MMRVSSSSHEEEGALVVRVPPAPDVPGDGLRLWSEWTKHLRLHAIDATLSALRTLDDAGEFPETGFHVRWRLFGDSLDNPASIGTAITLKDGSGSEHDFASASPAVRRLYETLEDFPTDVGLLDHLNQAFPDPILAPEIETLERRLLGSAWVESRRARLSAQAIAADLPQGRLSRPPRM